MKVRRKMKEERRKVIEGGKMKEEKGGKESEGKMKTYKCTYC